jgi:hypothetical protein
MEYSGSVLPHQKVSLREKDQEWKEKSLDAILSRSKVGGIKYERQRISYDMIDSNFDLNDLKYVTNPYKVNEGFPAQIQNVNIVTPKIKLLVGESSKRPQNVVVFRSGEASSEDILNIQKEMIIDALSNQILNQADPATKQEELQQRLKEIKEYISSKYYSPEERAADNTIKYLRKKLNLDDIFMRGFEDGLISNEEIYYVGIINGEPYMERVNPLAFSYDRSTDLKGIEEGDWCIRRMEMTPSEIHDRFYDIMDDGTFDDILNYIYDGNRNYGTKNTGSTLNTSYLTWTNLSNMSDIDLNEPERKNSIITVEHGVWRSYKKIGYLTYIDENGQEQDTLVDETYKVSPEETIKWGWIDEIWEGYRAGNDIYFGIQPIQYQDYSIEEPRNIPLPYVGGWYNGNNSEGKSLVELMKPLQYFYLILFYRLELMLARDNGKIINMDITQIPTSMGIDEYKWMHYLKSMGINFFNPYEEGYDIPGREGGKPAAFNQFGSTDLTMSNVIKEYIELMAKVEDMIGELSGVSKARQGQIHQSSLVGNVRQEITQSSHITEFLFWRHGQHKAKALQILLDISRYAWKRSNRKKINYILEGPERVFIDINDDFLYSDFDIFVSDSTREHDQLQDIKNLYQAALQNGSTLLDVANIITSSSMSEVKTKLEQLEQKRMQMASENAKAEQQMNEVEMKLKEEELRIKEEDSIRKAETALQIAELQNDDKVEENNDIDLEKLNLQKEKQKQDYEIKLKTLQEKERSDRAKEQLSRQTANNKNNN